MLENLTGQKTKEYDSLPPGNSLGLSIFELNQLQDSQDWKIKDSSIWSKLVSRVRLEDETKLISNFDNNYQSRFNQWEWQAIHTAQDFLTLGLLGQKRKDKKTTSSVHSLEVAEILAKLPQVDAATIILSLLHDVSEDALDSWPGGISAQEIKSAFAVFGDIPGTEINLGNFIADGIQALTKVKSKKHKDFEAETLIKIFDSLSEPRIALVKLADRLHNMQTIGALSREDQIRKARETMNVYVPLAEYFGLSEWAQKLAIYSIKILHTRRIMNISDNQRGKKYAKQKAIARSAGIDIPMFQSKVTYEANEFDEKIELYERVYSPENEKHLKEYITSLMTTVQFAPLLRFVDLVILRPPFYKLYREVNGDLSQLTSDQMRFDISVVYHDQSPDENEQDVYSAFAEALKKLLSIRLGRSQKIENIDDIFQQDAGLNEFKSTQMEQNGAAFQVKILPGSSFDKQSASVLDYLEGTNNPRKEYAEAKINKLYQNLKRLEKGRVTVEAARQFVKDLDAPLISFTDADGKQHTAPAGLTCLDAAFIIGPNLGYSAQSILIKNRNGYFVKAQFDDPVSDFSQIIINPVSSATPKDMPANSDWFALIRLRDSALALRGALVSKILDEQSVSAEGESNTLDRLIQRGREHIWNIFKLSTIEQRQLVGFNASAQLIDGFLAKFATYIDFTKSQLPREARFLLALGLDMHRWSTEAVRSYSEIMKKMEEDQSSMIKIKLAVNDDVGAFSQIAAIFGDDLFNMRAGRWGESLSKVKAANIDIFISREEFEKFQEGIIYFKLMELKTKKDPTQPLIRDIDFRGKNINSAQIRKKFEDRYKSELDTLREEIIYILDQKFQISTR